MQAFQRRARASRIKDCKRLIIVIRYVERIKCGFKSIILQYPLKFVAFTDVAFKAQFEEPIGLASRGLATVLCEDRDGDECSENNDKVNFIDFAVGRRRRVVRSIFSAEFNGLVDSIERMLVL